MLQGLYRKILINFDQILTFFCENDKIQCRKNRGTASSQNQDSNTTTSRGGMGVDDREGLTILVCCKQESVFCRKLRFPVLCVFNEIHSAQCREQLLNSVNCGDSAAGE